jgi:hypothetical protein
MKFKRPVSLNVLSPQSLFEKADLLRAIQTLCELLPEITPDRWGWYEPLRHPFRLDELQTMVPPGSERCETTYWNRTRKPKAEGSFIVRWCSASPRALDTHSKVKFDVELGHVSQDSLIRWLRAQSIRSGAHLAFLDVVVPARRAFLMECQAVPYGGGFILVTHVLRHWLPDVFWGTVFGPPYVTLFGKDRLLTAPVSIVEEIADDMIYVQLTESLTDNFDALSLVEDRRAAFKRHIGVDAFYQKGRGYDLRETGPVGDTFVVPEFKLLPVER